MAPFDFSSCGELEDDSSTSSSPSSSFSRTSSSSAWLPGLKVSPQEPQFVSFNIGLRITQAILGDSCTDESDKNRSVLLMKIGDQPEFYLCSLQLRYREMCSLRLGFEGPYDIVFSVKGPREIHLNGYLYDDHAIPKQVVGEHGGNGSGKDQPSCSLLGGAETSKNTTECVQKATTTSCKPLLNMNFQTLVNLSDADIANKLNKITKDGSIDIVLQGVTQAQIQAFSKSLNGKLESEKSTRRKLHYHLENEVKETVEQDASHRTTTQAITPYEGSDDGNLVKRSTRNGSPEYHVLHASNKQKEHNEEDDDHNSEKSARQKLHYRLENELREGVEQDASHKTATQAIILSEESDANGNGVGRSTRHGSPEYHVLHSGKSKRINKKKKHNEDDDEIERSTRHGSPEYHVLHSGKSKRLNKQKKHNEDDNEIDRSEKHDTLQTFKTDSDEEKKRKKKSRKHKQVEADHNSSDWRSQLLPESRQRIVNKIMETLKRHLPFSGSEGLQELNSMQVATRFEEKIYSAATSQSDYLWKISSKMVTIESKSHSSFNNALPSNSAGTTRNPQDSVPSQNMQPQPCCVSAGLSSDHAVDIKKAKNAKKSKKNEVVQEKMRSQEAEHLSVLLALPCQNKH